jgi:hypothetical protein
VTKDLARCDREIAEASQQMEVPAWLVTLWAEDWERVGHGYQFEASTPVSQRPTAQ